MTSDRIKKGLTGVGVLVLALVAVGVIVDGNQDVPMYPLSADVNPVDPGYVNWGTETVPGPFSGSGY